MGATKKSKKSKQAVEQDDSPLVHATSARTADSSHSGPQLVHLEDVQEKPRKKTKVEKTKAHFARFWCCYLLAIIVLLAIGLPVLFLKIMPAIAQLIVDKTSLPISNAVLSPISNSAVLIGLQTALTVPAGLTVKLDPLELWLYNKDTKGFKPYTMVNLDGQRVKGHTNIEVKDSVVGIGDRDELNTWLHSMLYNKETEISVKGNTTAHLGALHFGIKLKKTVKINALDQLRGYSLLDSRLVLPPEADGTNLVGNLSLPNWSDLKIGLGNLTFNVFAGDLLIGSVATYDVVLPPGNTTKEFKGQIFLDTVFENILPVISSQADALTKGSVAVSITGNSTIVNGEHIRYLERALEGGRFTAEVPVVQLLTNVFDSIKSGQLSLPDLVNTVGDNLGNILDGIFGTSGDGNSTGDNPIKDVIDGLNETWSGWNGKSDLEKRILAGVTVLERKVHALGTEQSN